jgi:chemotaxis protein methyltransferase CheR
MMTATLSEAEFSRFRTLIYERAGIHLTPNKRGMLAGRLARRLRALRIDGYREYLRRVESSDDELTEMLDVVTTNETRFFREQQQFEYLEAVLIPRWIADAARGARRQAVRVWSAGCSTGEEPFSVAMSLLAGLGDSWNISVFATDLSTRVLETARAAVWPLDKAAQIPAPYRKAFLLRGTGPQAGRVKATPELRSLVTFARLNLHQAEYPGGPFDLILCRNVLIYFDAASRRAVIDRLVDRLDPGGTLFIGHAETLHGVTARVRSVRPTVYRKEVGA